MVRVAEARRATLSIYFVFGFAVIAWVPRIPEIKANVGVSAATFGALTSLGTVGAILSSFIASRMIHVVGSKRVVAIVGTTAFTFVATLPFLNTAWIYGLVICLYGMSTNALSTALNVQSLHIEERRGVPSMSAFHGLWAAGALSTSVVSSVVVNSIALHIQLPLVAFFAIAVLWTQLARLVTHEEEHNEDDTITTLKDLLRPSRTALLLGLGISAGSFAEYASGDWAAIYVRDVLGSSLSRAAFAVSFVLLAITVSRLLGDRLVTRFGPARVIRSAGTAIFGGLALVSLAGHFVQERASLLAVITTYVGFFIAGLGSGVVVPIFISATTNISAPRAVALGQVVLIQQTSIWLLKTLTAFSVGAAGLRNAILVPAIVALGATALAGLTTKVQPAKQPSEQ